MLVKGDKIKNIKQIEGAPVKVGEICEVTAIYNDVIQFKFGNGMHMGSMNQKEYEEYFEKVEPVKSENKIKVPEDKIFFLMDEANVDVRTVFNRCTVVTVELPNGYIISESFEFANKEDYDEEIGKDICMGKIEEKLWELEEYHLTAELYEEELFEDACEEEWDFFGFNEDEEECNCCDDCELDECDEDCEGYEHCSLCEKESEEKGCKHNWVATSVDIFRGFKIKCTKCGEEKFISIFDAM
jgi:hypothetical protein